MNAAKNSNAKKKGMQNYVSAKILNLIDLFFYRIMDNLSQIRKAEKENLEPFSTMDLTFLKRKLQSKNYLTWEELFKNSNFNRYHQDK
jgi:hypothetical protein